MTTRMTVAVTVLTFGFAIAALAGIPALIENRSVGDVVVVIGFAVAIVGLVLLFAAIPGQRDKNGAIKGNEQFEVDRLRVERRRLKTLLQHAQTRLSSASMTVRSSAFSLNGGGQDILQLRGEVADLESALENNAIELRRRGAEPGEG